MKNRLVAFLICAITTSPLYSFTIPDAQTFYNPVIGSFVLNINEPSTTQENYKQIQNAIDSVHVRGGGVVKIKATSTNRIYNITKSIKIKTGVHIRITPEVIFKSDHDNKINMFTAGKAETEVHIENFSFECSKNNQFIHFDFTNRLPGVKEGGAVAISIGAARNFHVSDIQVVDNFTPFSCITVNLLDYEDASGTIHYKQASNGIIEHCELVSDGHYGYGLIQCQAAKNVLFRDLKGHGGVALRLETGAIGKANLANPDIHIDNVYGNHIECTNGQAAITMSPHTVNNGKVFIKNLTATSCEAGAIINKGFFSKSKGQADEDGNPINGYTLGYFHNESVIKNLKVIYGINGQLRGVRRVFVPCSQKHLINDVKNEDEESYQGPTVAGIVYFAVGGMSQDSGYYSVNLPGIEMMNFPEVNSQLENEIFVTHPNDHAYKNCVISSSVNSLLDEDVHVFYDESGNPFLSAPVGCQIQVYDVQGVLGSNYAQNRRTQKIDVNGAKYSVVHITTPHGHSFSKRVMHR